jgi:putative endonuclease
LRKGPGFACPDSRNGMQAHREAPAGSQKGGKQSYSSFFRSKAMYIVYIIYSKTPERYYVGYTNDLDRRLTEHNRKKGKYTDTGIPWILVHYEVFQQKKLAMQREKFIKSKKSKFFIKELIDSA